MLAALIVAGGYKIQALAADNELLEARADALAADNARLSGELQNNLAALLEREEARLRLVAETDNLKFKLGEIYETDTLAADWSVVDLPDAIVECLREALPGPGPARLAACGLVAGRARAAIAGAQQ